MDFLEKQRLLPEPVNIFFSSDNPRLELESSCYMYDVPDENIQNISKEIGLIFINEIELENLPKIISENLHLDKLAAYGVAYEINRRVFNRFPEYFVDSQQLLDAWSKQKSEPALSEDEAWQKVLEVEPWIAEEQQEKRMAARNIEEAQIKIEKISLAMALKKYPEAGEQLITSNKIILKNFIEPVRPSVKNWLSDYTFTMGFDTHDSAAQNTYLFRNENAKKLSTSDRARLGYILKAFDTNELIEINLTLKQIIFPKLALVENKPDSNPQEKTPSPISSANKEEAEPLKDIFEKKSFFFQKKPTKPKLSGTFTISRQTPAEIPPAKLPVSMPSAPTALRKISTPVVAATSKMEFTSPQKLPFEKQQSQPTAPTKPAQPITNRPLEKPVPTSNPIRITPTHFKRITPLKNIVDLKK